MHIISSSRRSTSSWAIVLPFAGLLALDQPATQPPARTTPAAPSQAERIAVPLTDPSKPARLDVALLGGGITVRGHEGRDVSVEVRVRQDADERDCRGCDKSGLTRLANTASGLVIEEQDNRVRIKSQVSNRALDLVVLVPTHTSLKLSVVNDGDIVVERVDGEIEVQNTNGAVTLTDVAGSVVAHALNDDLKVSMTRLDAKPMSFSSLNGDIDVALPADAKVNVKMESGMGDIESDFAVEMLPSTATQKVEDKRGQGGALRIVVDKAMVGRINGGGPEMTFKNFNGDIRIRRRR
jgi:hypothetical protein